GDTLWYLTEPGHLSQGSSPVVVASEPYDDDPRWQEVPDRTLLEVSRTDVLLTPLKDPGADPRDASHHDMTSVPTEESST
ncbi:MAG: class II glutamine amidotransferase, partial [Streptomyces sp.]|nr:class II glutamine amidotransferase [Streptomyces sp.]